MRVVAKRFAVVAAAVAAAVLTLGSWIFSGASPGAVDERKRSDDAAEAIRPFAQDVAIGPGGLAIPVAGIKAGQLVDSYTEHDGLDILAPAGTPVVAAAPGRVEKLDVSSGADGITASVRSNDARWIYYYAHLQGHSPSLREGQRVERGQAIGSVGWTGSASPRGPHLHFEMRRMSDGEPSSQGKAVNPYPFLTGRGG